MGEAARELEYRYSWADYREWPKDERWELVSGEPFAMSPAPSLRHQHVVTALGREVSLFLQGRPCRAFVSPVDVRLSDDDVVEPDIVVVCDEGRMRETHIEGAPTLVVEVSSPATAHHDRIRKMPLYAKHGVKEYWIVTPYPPSLEIYINDGDTFRLHSGFDERQTLTSPTFPGLEIELARVFDFPLPPETIVHRVRESPPPYPADRSVPPPRP